MTYKKSLFFIGKCLTISHEKHNKILVEEELKSGNIDWDNIVKVSTSHYVFPALYINLKRAGFLEYLPKDLVDYMKRITDLNRERNQQIIEQAKEINDLLLKNNITPIFLKGTGNLLEGLYEDIAERMVGDIDVLVSKKQTNEAYEILKNQNYIKQNNNTQMLPNHRHLPRIIHKNKIAAIEIHKEILRSEKAEEFSYNHLFFEKTNNKDHYSLNINHQLLTIILTKQINDFESTIKTFSLRNMYDIYLFSRVTNTLNAINEFDFFYEKSNSAIALASHIFNNPTSILFENNQFTREYINSAMKGFTRNKKLLKFYINSKNKAIIVLKSIYKKKYRTFVKNRLKPNS